MMMNRRRSLFVIGCLMVAFVVFASKAAFAQTTPTQFEVDARSYHELSVEWESDGANTDSFSVRYQEMAGTGVAFDDTKSDTKMTVAVDTSDNDYRVVIDELKPGTRYIVGLTAVGDTNAAPTPPVIGESTDDADEPDDVRNLELMAGDRMIMAMWEETTDNGSPVTGYTVQYKMSDEPDSKYKTARMGTMENTSTEWTISNLENDMEYTVRVNACSFGMCGDWSDEEDATPMAGAMMPTPTPALPLFGAFALGAGLLAAGRRRLRRQRLLNS